MALARLPCWRWLLSDALARLDQSGRDDRPCRGGVLGAVLDRADRGRGGVAQFAQKLILGSADALARVLAGQLGQRPPDLARLFADLRDARPVEREGVVPVLRGG